MADAPDTYTDDDLAAEYVLGVLDADMREAAQTRIAQDAAFARLVSDWEARLSGLNDAYEPVEPPRAVKSAIDARLFPAPPKRRPWAKLSGLFAGGLAALVGLFFLLAPAAPELGAQLQADGSDYLLEVEVTDGRLTAALLSGAVPDGQTLEFWQIIGEAAPVSLGTLDSDALQHGTAYAEGHIVAVSLEPAGGSPTGAPTGPVVALGVLEKI